MKRMPRKNATRYPKAELVAKQCQQRTTREINFGGHSGRLFNIWGVFRVDRGIAAAEVVVELLNAVHARLSDCALGDLANGREGHPGFSSNPLLRDLLFRKSRHHEFVDIELASHG